MNQEQNLKIRPFLKWAGGKFAIIDKILACLPTADRLIEPFTGSGSIFINSNFSTYLLGEQNKDLVNLYLCLQREGQVFINFCEELFSKENNSPLNYYSLREVFNNSSDLRYKSALFLYLNRHGYNGLCRYNSKGIYNVPFGKYEKPYFPRKEMDFFHKKSQGITIVHSDFRNLFASAAKSDIIYCDPPYVALSNTAKFSSYTKRSFSTADQLDLVSLAINAANKGIPVIISNHDTPETRKYYRDSEIVSFEVNRYISCKKIRQPVQELIAIFK